MTLKSVIMTANFWSNRKENLNSLIYPKEVRSSTDGEGTGKDVCQVGVSECNQLGKAIHPGVSNCNHYSRCLYSQGSSLT